MQQITGTTIPFQESDVLQFDWLTTMGYPCLTFVIVALVAYFCIRIQRIPTKLMWIFVPVGTMFYALLADDNVKKTLTQNLLYNGAIGLALSILGVFASMGAHDKLFRLFAKWWPPLGWLVADEDSGGQKPTDGK